MPFMIGPRPDHDHAVELNALARGDAEGVVAARRARVDRNEVNDRACTMPPGKRPRTM